MASERTYGEIPGYSPGSTFRNRDDLRASGVHRPNQAGICGGSDGAESIVVSGGYVDDEDYGSEIIYTGQGGNDPTTKRQTADQQLTRGNLGLARSQIDGNPVRVVRGAAGDPVHSPKAGLRYDGLFRVVDHWLDTGKDGFKIGGTAWSPSKALTRRSRASMTLQPRPPLARKPRFSAW